MSGGNGGSGGAYGGGAYPYINEDSANKLFDEICDEDDPNVAGMEGEFIIIQWSLLFCSVSNNNLFAHTNNATPPQKHNNIFIFIITGICKLCEQLNLDPLEDVRVLVLLYKLGANKKPAEISKEEWMTGCNKLRLDSIDKFTNFLPALDTGFMESDEFKDFYKVRE